jgi:hypothetical protein
MAKATHYGHCQVCGSRQKLPGGLLAKHGYTTRWGFFSGTCHGSGHLPFELDTSLIEAAIERAQFDRTVILDEAAEVRTQADPDGCWVHAYYASNERGGSGYRWIRTQISYGDGPCRTISYWHPGDGRPARWDQLGYYESRDLVEAARWSNARYAKSYLEPRAKGLAEYAQWQQARLVGWAPKDLEPVA